MRRLSWTLAVFGLLAGARAAQAQWRGAPEFPRAAAPVVQLGAGAPNGPGWFVPTPALAPNRAHPTWTMSSDDIRRTHWLVGGVVGSALLGIVGASTGMALAGCACAKDALLGFIPGAMIGFPIGALIGGQFPIR